MVHRFSTRGRLSQFSHCGPGLAGGALAFFHRGGERDGLLGETNLRANAPQSKDPEDMRKQGHVVSPIADVVGDRGIAVPFAEPVTDMSCRDRSADAADLGEQAASELQHSTPVRGRSLGKEDDGKVGVKGSFDPSPGLQGRAAVSARHEDGPGHLRHPAQHRVGGQLGLRDEDAGVKRGEDHDVQIPQVVGDDSAMLGKASDERNLDSQAMQGIGSKPMQPLRPRLARCGPPDQQLRAVLRKVSCKLKTASDRSKEAHPPPKLLCAQSILRAVEDENSSLEEVIRPGSNKGPEKSSEPVPEPAPDPVPEELLAPRSLLYRRLALPFLALLRVGTSPERLAWSIAAGLLIGINPLLGSTTLLCFAVAMLFRLNLAASQLANHVIYPLQLLLLIPFLHLGSRLFHAPPLPLSAHGLLEEAKRNPFELMRRLWLWEWHALILWATLTAVLIAPLALGLTPLLRRLSQRLQQRGRTTQLAP